MNIEFIKGYLDQIDKELDSISESILSGGMQDMPHYKQMIGRREGLLLSRNRLIERFSDEDKAVHRLKRERS